MVTQNSRPPRVYVQLSLPVEIRPVLESLGVKHVGLSMTKIVCAAIKHFDAMESEERAAAIAKLFVSDEDGN